MALTAAAQVAPVADPANLIREIVAAQGERDKAREAYIYRWHYRVDSQDAKVNLHPVRDEEYDVFFVNGHAVRRLLKRSGEELERGGAGARGGSRPR